jgi:hypothetical protein
MVKYSSHFGRIRNRVLGAVALSILLGFLLQNVAGGAYYSLLMEPKTTVMSPPVELQEGTAENSTSTIYTNSTSAKVSVESSGDFKYVLNMTEKRGSNWTVRLSAYNQSDLNSLNCSIYIYDGSDSTQIVILNGTYVNQTGPLNNLNASDTEYIWMHVETSGAETYYVYVYLEIRVPDKTTYARYIITFEIT